MELQLRYKYSFIVVLLFFCVYALADNSVYRLDFTEENLEFELSDGKWKLDGDYMFSNYSPEDITQNIYFPIPADSSALPAYDVSIKIIKPLKGQKCKLLNINPKGFWFELTMPAQTIAVCKIKYKQKLIGNRAHYILLTANSWGKPLEYANYTLNVPNKLRLKAMPLDNPIVKKGMFHKKYVWEYTNFSPDKDFIVEFE